MFPYSLVYSQNYTVYFQILWFWLLFPEPYVHLRRVYMFIKLMKYFLYSSWFSRYQNWLYFSYELFSTTSRKIRFYHAFKRRSIWSKSFTALTVRRREVPSWSGGSGNPRKPWLNTDTLFTCSEELFAFPKKAPTKRIPKKQFQRILKEPSALMSIWRY